MRTVLANDEIPHLWAHQTQASARNANSSLSFNGPRLSSYTTVIAEIVTNSRGETAAVLSTRKYSVTTTQHQSGARMATQHLIRLYVDAVEWSPERQREAFAAEIRLAMETIADARNKISRAKRYDAANDIVSRRCRCVKRIR